MIINTNNTLKCGTFQENSFPETKLKIKKDKKELSTLDLVTGYNATTDVSLKGAAGWLEKSPKWMVQYAIKKMSKLERNVLNRILACRADNPTRPVFLGYESLAKEFKCAAYSVHRVVKRLISKRLISIIHHVYNGNQYKVHPLFDELKFRGWLGCFLSSLRKTVAFISLSLSMLISPSVKLHIVTVEANRDSILFNNRSVTVSNFSKPSNVRAREEHGTDFQKTREREREKVSSESLNFIENSLTSIDLTIWGKQNIACFPVAAIEYAQTKMKATRGAVRDRYALFKSFCLEYCRTNNIRVDFSRVDKIKKLNPEVEVLGYYRARRADDESQPVYKRPTSDWDPRHAFKAEPLDNTLSLATERDGLKKYAEQERASGIEPNFFMRQLLGEVEYKPKQANIAVDQNTQDMFKKPSVTVSMPMGAPAAPVLPLPVTDTFEPLEESQLELINKILEHNDLLGNTEEAQFILSQIGALMTQGAQHPLAHSADFWNGMGFVSSVIDQEYAKQQEAPTVIDVQLRVG